MRLFLKIIRILIIAFFVSSIGATLYYRWMPVERTPLMIIRDIEKRINGEEPRRLHRWVPIDSISRYLPLAVIASEDQNFLNHHGFDFNAITDAIDEEKRTGRRRGASTISQQTAKNVFLWPSSTWVRKGFEAYFTVLIELLWSKERIMEVYLNSIEMGDGIYGAEAVAQENFGRHAADLKRDECALIAATLPNPRRFSSKLPSKYMRSRRQWIMKQMKHIPAFPID